MFQERLLHLRVLHASIIGQGHWFIHRAIVLDRTAAGTWHCSEATRNGLLFDRGLDRGGERNTDQIIGRHLAPHVGGRGHAIIVGSIFHFLCLLTGLGGGGICGIPNRHIGLHSSWMRFHQRGHLLHGLGTSLVAILMGVNVLDVLLLLLIHIVLIMIVLVILDVGWVHDVQKPQRHRHADRHCRRCRDHHRPPGRCCCRWRRPPIITDIRRVVGRRSSVEMHANHVVMEHTVLRQLNRYEADHGHPSVIHRILLLLGGGEDLHQRGTEDQILNTTGSMIDGLLMAIMLFVSFVPRHPITTLEGIQRKEEGGGGRGR